MLSRLTTAAYLAMLTALWCWLLTASYVIWKFGFVEGYLALGQIPFNPSIPINYLLLFILTFGAFGITFVTAFALTAIAPPRLRLLALCMAWIVGGAFASLDASFLFLDHGGGTWLPHEAFLARFYHPIATPFWIVFGLAGTASLTRSLRAKP